MKTLGIDFGEKRIGLAISDEGGRVAVPLTTLERTTDRRAVGRIAALAREEGVALLILGEPRNLDGTVHASADRVQRFGAKLVAATGLPLRLREESLTSVEAEERLRAAGFDPRRDKSRLDAVAAQILLQEALDEPSPP
jgi:putative pre-16S rRNA nuclease